MKKRILHKVKPEQVGLGLPTVMDRTLAAEHGSAYVKLAVFAIDVDRVYHLDPERAGLPLGWEVLLTQAYLCRHYTATPDSERALIEALCLTVLDAPPGEPLLGAQITFAVYDAVQRGELSASLAVVFHRWRSAPKQLLSALQELRQQSGLVPELASYCLNAPLRPPLAAPTEEALHDLAKTADTEP